MGHLNKLKYNFFSRDMNLELKMESFNHSRIVDYYNKNDNISFWYSITYNGLKDLPLMAIKVKFLKEKIKDGTYPTYLMGLCHYLDNNPIMTKEIIEQNSDTKLLFEMAINTGVPEIIKFIKNYVFNTDIITYKKLIHKLIKERDRDRLLLILNNTTKNNQNNHDYFRMLISENLISYQEIKSFIIENKIDINFSSNAQFDQLIFSKRKFHASRMGGVINISQEIFCNTNIDIFKNFVIDFQKEINWDKSYSTYGERVISIYSSLIEFLGLNFGRKDSLDRIEFILDSCKLNEQTVTHVFNQILSPNIIFNNYSHPVFNKVFENNVLKNELFDIKKLAKKILLIKQNNKKESYVSHPVISLLKKIYENSNFSNVKDNSNLFYIWAKTQNKFFSREVCDFLIVHHKNEINNLSQKQWGAINKVLYDYIKNKGFNVPNRKTIWDKFLAYFIKEKENKIVEKDMKQYIKKEASIYDVAFDHVLFDRINDSDVKRLVSMIEINKQQYDLLKNKDTYSENHHYMNTTLANILNKIIENYLFLNIINEDESKEQICIHLKLLNKKTLEVLNEVLKREEEMILKNNKVINKVLAYNIDEQEHNAN